VRHSLYTGGGVFKERGWTRPSKWSSTGGKRGKGLSWSTTKGSGGTIFMELVQSLIYNCAGASAGRRGSRRRRNLLSLGWMSVARQNLYIEMAT